MRPACRLGAIILALAPLNAVAAQDGHVHAFTGSMEPCLEPHGDRDIYRAGLHSMGWADVSDAGRPAALAMIADAFLPVTGQITGDWDAHMGHRGAARAFWTDLAHGRTIMAREDRVLLLAGFLDDNGEMRIECWSAGPVNSLTDAFFAAAGQIWQTEGVQMTQLVIAADAVHPDTEIFVDRLTGPAGVDPAAPPLAATDGLRTRITYRPDAMAAPSAGGEE